MTILIKYESCAYFLYANGKMITQYSRNGLPKAKKQAEDMVNILGIAGVKAKIEIDLSDIANKRKYPANFGYSRRKRQQELRLI